VPASQISPDGREYVYLPSFQSYGYTGLAAFDLETGTSRPVGEYQLNGGLQMDWLADGIHVIPLKGLAGAELLIDPTTGSARWIVVTSTRPPTFTPLPGDPHGTDGTGFHSIGVTGDGRLIWWFFNLDRPSAVDWVFHETAPGVRVYIYKGKQGDSTGFDPGIARADSTGIWFSDHSERQLVWHWAAGDGLHKVNVSDLPNVFNVVPAHVKTSLTGPRAVPVHRCRRL